MKWTDGMEYQLIKIAKTHHGGHGEVVSAVSIIAQLSQFEKQLHYW